MIATYPVDDVWPYVKPKLEAICRRQGKPLAKVDEAYHLCKDGKAFLYNNDEDESFAIVQPRVDNSETILYIWAAWGQNGQRERNMEFLREIARGIGAACFEMRSRRRGFARAGWEVKDIADGDTIYTRKVEE